MVTLIARRGVLPAALVAVSLVLFASPAGAAPQIDPSFGSNGFAMPSVFPRDKKFQHARGLAFQYDGKLVVPMTLSTRFGYRSRRPVIRLKADGSRDRSYGKSGVAWVRAGGAPFITLQGAKPTLGDGTLIWGDYFFADDRYSPDGVFVTRLTASGAVDKSFGDRGSRRFSLHIPGHDTEFLDVSPTDDGGVVVSIDAYSLKRERSTIRATRLDGSGAIDRTFGKRGTKSFILDQGTQLGGFSNGLLVAGNSIYMSLNSRGKCIVRRYVLNGSVPLDRAFGMDGEAKLGRVCGGGMSATAAGGVLVHGERFEKASGPVGFIQRLRADGSLDSSFGQGGSVVVPSVDFVARVVELPGGGVLASGWCDALESLQGCLVVVDAAGAPELRFGKSGTLTLAKYRFGDELVIGGVSVAALVNNDASSSGAPTQILKLTN